MKRSTLYTGIAYIFFGIICITTAMMFEFKFESFLWGLGGAGIGPGISMVFKYMHWSKPENLDEYNEKLRAEKIERSDERKIMLRDKSGRIMYSIMMGVHFVLMMIFYYYANSGLFLPFSMFMVIGLGLILAVQFIGGVIIFNYLNNRL